MAKPYWRVKRKGKWTWVAAKILTVHWNDDEDGSEPYESYEIEALRGEEK